jgi:hypothetical protein
MTVALLAVIVMLAAVTATMFWPLRSHHRPGRAEPADNALIVARDSKLGELNDLELDFRLGKLSAEDYGDLNATLRTEAVEIMRQIEES